MDTKAARLGTLVEPAFTGLDPFLATDAPPSSGIMILEYVAHSAVADIRRLAAPAALGSAVLSRGVEEHAQAGAALGAAFELAAAALSPDPADRPLDGDLATAQLLLPGLAALCPVG